MRELTKHLRFLGVGLLAALLTLGVAAGMAGADGIGGADGGGWSVGRLVAAADQACTLPPLRCDYVAAVRGIADEVAVMRAAGRSAEDIARWAHGARRDIGVKYKNLTPSAKLEEIYTRNLNKYGDKLGPTVEWLREKGKSWEDIITSASRTGGADLGF